MLSEKKEQLKRELSAALGNHPFDLILRNVRLVDVYSEQIRTASLGISGERIVAVDPPPDAPAKEIVDCNQQYALPGLIDTHVHVETTLLTPEALADVLTPWGTTTLIVDAMEIANVAGKEGLEALISDPDALSYRIYLAIPSRVPTAPGLETTGATLGVAEVAELLQLPQSASLGELDPAKILQIQDPYLEKILEALRLGRICNGHAIGLGPADLNVYATAHLADDHECVTPEELQNRLRVGMAVMIREGSSERNAKTLLDGVVAAALPTDSLMFCTDDKHVQDIAKEGHISFNVQLAVDAGMDPLKAIKMATLNGARHFHLEHEIGSLAPGRYADIVLTGDLKRIRPTRVYKSGRLVAENGSRISPYKPKAYPDHLFETVILPPGLSEQSFALKAEGDKATCRVIRLIENQIINKGERVSMPVTRGEVKADAAQDILKIAVVERYGKNGQVGLSFVRGFGLKTGAMASSVSHDHHNIVVVGTNDRDMLLACRQIESMQGGFALACEGRVMASVALPLAGLMSMKPAEAVIAGMAALNRAAAEAGCRLDAPFMTLSFVSLPTVPELGLTDLGLVDVLSHQLIDEICEP